MVSVVRRRAKQWFITVGGLEYYDRIRSDFLLYFDGVEEYCVSIEGFTKPTVHCHAYLKFHDFAYFEILRDLIPVSGTVNIQVCKSRRNTLKYVTKEDECPLFNCSESELSFAYRARAWAKRTPLFRFYDPFVLEYPQYYRLLSELHKEVCDRRRSVVPVNGLLSTWYPGWAMSMYESLAAFIYKRSSKQLYIYGPSGTGKTYTLSLLLKELGFFRIYMPVPGQFFFGDFSASAYDCVMFEEFDFDLFQRNFSQIKRLLNGERFSVDVKGSRQRILAVRCPIFFVSNFDPPYDKAFLRRVTVIHAIEEMEGKARIATVKPEDEPITSFIEISSDEDEEEDEVSLSEVPETNVQAQES